MDEQKEQNGKNKKKRGKKGAMSVLGGGFLVKEKFTKQFPFMVYVTVLLMAIITNTYIAEERNRELTRTAKQLNDLQVKYIELQSSIMQASKQSVLSKKLADIGLKEATEPLKRINVNDETENTEEP